MKTKKLLTVLGLGLALISSAENLVVNGDLEVKMDVDTWKTDGTDWEVAYNNDRTDQVAQAGEVTWGFDWCYEGDYGLRLKPDGGGNTEAVAHQDIAVTENTTYNYSFVARMEELGENHVNSKAVFTIKNGGTNLTLIGNAVVSGNKIEVMAQTWTVYSGTVTVPAGCTSVRFNLYKGKFAGGSPAIYFDNFELEDTSVVTGMRSATQSVINVYPNPVVNELNVSANKDIESLQVYHISGQLVNSHLVGAMQSRIDFSNNATGQYFIQLHMADGTSEMIKFLK